MAEIVNLRRVRKQKARDDAARTAEQNRISFGLSKAQRSLAKAERDSAGRKLEGHRLDGDDAPDKP